MSEIKKVGVLGCGLMGAGIAEVCARAELATVVREVSEEFLENGMSRIEKSLTRAVDKGKMESEQRDAVLDAETARPIGWEVDGRVGVEVAPRNHQILVRTREAADVVDFDIGLHGVFEFHYGVGAVIGGEHRVAEVRHLV